MTSVGDTYNMGNDVIRVIRVTDKTVVIEREMDHARFNELAAASIKNGAVLTKAEVKESGAEVKESGAELEEFEV